MLDVCQMLKNQLSEAQEQFGIFQNFLAQKEFSPARSAQKSAEFLIKYLGERVEEYIPPAEMVKVEFEIFPEAIAGRTIALSYTGTNRIQCKAYNMAIPEIFKAAGMEVIMSSGHHEEVGYKAFELIGFRAAGMATVITGLIPDIHKLAAEKYKEYIEFGFHKV